MKNIAQLLIVLMVFVLSGCELIGDIFGAGFYTGIIVVVLVIVILGYLVYKIFRR